MITVGSATTGAAWFLNGIGNLQQQQLKTLRELTSGFQIQDAADAPALTPELINLGSTLASVQAYQTNLASVQTEASAADSALGSAASLLDSARTLAVQGADSSATAASRQVLASQVQSLQQQLVSIANTSVGGHYIFGGATDQTPPYQYDAASVSGVDQLTTQTAGGVAVNTQGAPVYQGLTSLQIFDARDAVGAPTANNIFTALQSLASNLQANNQAGIAADLTGLQSASGYLGQQQAYYGLSEQRLTNEQNNAANQVTALLTRIAGIRETNVTQAATDLSQESVAQAAAYGAESLVSKKTLFDYLG
jgi:flagellar hook-associated protein 3 FlgL